MEACSFNLSGRTPENPQQRARREEVLQTPAGRSRVGGEGGLNGELILKGGEDMNVNTGRRVTRPAAIWTNCQPHTLEFERKAPSNRLFSFLSVANSLHS